VSLKRFEVSRSGRSVVGGLFIFTESYNSLNIHKTDELILRIGRLLAHSKKNVIFMEPEDTKPCYKRALI
jgi:hypothetical protein